MATIKKFEDLECWKNSRIVCQKVEYIIQTTVLKTEYKLKDQIDRASGSIMDNIAEGFGRGGNLEFIHFLFIAAGSCNECQSQLYRILDKKIIEENIFNETYNLLQFVRAQIFGLIGYLKDCEIKGVKFLGR